MHGRRGFLAALAGLAVCPQAPAARRSVVVPFASGGWVAGPLTGVIHGSEGLIPIDRQGAASLAASISRFYRPARRPIEAR